MLLSNTLNDFNNRIRFYGYKKFIIEKPENLNFLKEVEQYINLSASSEKITAFNDQIEKNQTFTNFATLKKYIGQKKKL